MMYFVFILLMSFFCHSADNTPKLPAQVDILFAFGNDAIQNIGAKGEDIKSFTLITNQLLDIWTSHSKI